MAKKKKVEKAPRQFTRRQISHLKKHKRRQNIIFYGGIGIIAAVIVIVLVGLYIGEIRPYRQTAIKVYDTEFSVRYFMDAAKYQLNYVPAESRLQYVQQAVQSNPDLIQRAELIRLGAGELGITVDDDEVKEYIKEQEEHAKQENLAQIEDLKAQGELTEEEYLKAKEDIEDFETPVNDASIDLTRTELLHERLNDEYFSPEIPERADQVNIMAMYLESENQVNDIKLKLEAGDNFTALAKEYSLHYYTKSVTADLGWHISDWLEYRLKSEIPFEYAFNAEPGTLSEPLYDENLDKKVGYWIVNVLERVGEDQAHLQVILAGDEQEAGMVLQRFIMGGDFGELARQFSQDENSRDNGGDLGMVTKDSRTDAVNAFVFNTEVLDVGVVGPFPDYSVTTKGGYWLINVIDKEANRPIGDEDKSYLENNVYSDWVEQLFEEAAEEIDTTYLSSDTIMWIMEKLQEEL